MTKPPAKRCAVYTRKSSEEGLDQSFNSLHAQREACEAYVKSQAHEGWTCSPKAYDDGGFSGGSMDRPGLKTLLADIDAGKIDIVVVYKVDRLTRSLADFARIVEAFEARGVSFVSVTQAFNTTSSMGRLTLNVLLSFAQFEREVTGERIRDKIAASKAKGMWMGGNLPLGYDSKERSLIVNEAEAAQVRHIFERYLVLGSVDALCAELTRDGYRSKRRTTRDGHVTGGLGFTRGALYHLLQNRLYRGEIPHKDKTYPGLHAAIVDEDLFNAVQQRLADQRVERSQKSIRRAAAKLTGRVFWPDGTPMTPAFAYGRHGGAYRYYAVQSAIDSNLPGERPPRRIPAAAFEIFTAKTLGRLAERPDGDWAALSPALVRVEVRAEDTHLIIDPDALLPGEHPDIALGAMRSRLHEGERMLIEPGQSRRLRLITPLRLSFRGGRTWLIGHAGEAMSGRSSGRTGAQIAAALKEAHAILERHGVMLARGDPLAKTKITSPGSLYERNLCRVAFLSPDLQRRILEGRVPTDLTLATLAAAPPPLLWSEQAAWFERLCRT